jgi:hypothetical protein
VKKFIPVTVALSLLSFITLISSPADQEGKVTRKQAAGEVVRFDPGQKVLVVRGEDGEKAFFADERTIVLGAKKSLTDLKAGDKVFIEFQMEKGRPAMKKIVVKPEKTIVLNPDTKGQGEKKQEGQR